jgi:YVTN family beta-propeller protein
VTEAVSIKFAADSFRQTTTGTPTEFKEMKMRGLALVMAMVGAVTPMVMVAQQAGPYKVLSTTKVGGEGGFDYVYADSANRKLYIPRLGPAGTITVFDLDTLQPAGEIANTSGHGVAVSEGHAFGSSKPVAMWDAKTLASGKTIDVDGGPDGIFADPFDGRVYVFSHKAPNATVIDPKTGAVLGTIDLGGAPEQAASDGKGHIFVDLEDKGKIAVIDAKAMKLAGNYDLQGKGDGCAGLAIDVKHELLFAACREPQAMVILSAKDGKIVDTLPIGKGSDGAVFNPATGEVFSSQGDGTLTIIKEKSPKSFVVEETLTTMPRAKTLTLDTKTNKLFLISAEFGPVPAAEPGQKPGRAPMVPGTFSILTVGK